MKEMPLYEWILEMDAIYFDINPEMGLQAQQDFQTLVYVTGPITVWEDNQSCIKQAANPCDREAQKHIDVRAHYLRTSSPKQRLNELCFDSLTDSRRSQQKITEAGLFFFLNSIAMRWGSPSALHQVTKKIQ
jgi:hypothetical protein